MKTRNNDTKQQSDDVINNNCNVTSSLNPSEEDAKTDIEEIRQGIKQSSNSRKSTPRKNKTVLKKLSIEQKIGFDQEKKTISEDVADVDPELEINNSNLNNNSSQVRKNEEVKKSRNLDSVVRRMLKAKKESEKQNSENFEGIKDSENDDNVVNSLVAGSPKETVDIQKNMIDIQASTASHHLPSSTRLGNPPSETRHQHSPARDVINDSCSSRSSDSPITGPASDNESPAIKPFVTQTNTSSGTVEENKAMSPGIKQEPLSALDGRLSMYHSNGPVTTHSPPSSYGSHPSPGRRSVTPTSPPGSRNPGALPSPPELILNPSLTVEAQAQHINASAAAAMLMMNGGVSSFSPMRYARHSPSGHSPHSVISSTPYGNDRRSPGVTAAAIAASGLGLPTLVPSMSAIPHNGPPPPMFSLSPSQNGLLARPSMVSPYSDASEAYSQQRRSENEARREKVSPHAPTGPNPPRGIIGQKEANAVRMGNNRGRGGNNSSQDEKCTYKRPPHTYPALIASAILDSPGNLITLRGIYDYIMNNFPYYKFGHDKSAWQNSIRHNLSLNQCFVKVPRYENAAKSNYWTMTREGFEEFGNENSFKRRRRRGAALAPISAYKNKKYISGNSDANRNAKRSSDQGGLPNGTAKNAGPSSVMNFPGWAGRSRTPEPGVAFNGARDAPKAAKRSQSPGSRIDGSSSAKHPRMVVLKRGDGPTLDGINSRSEHPQRPNSLSSVEEMQGNLNSFSKSLSAGSENTSAANKSPRRNPGTNSPLNHPTPEQQWMMAAAAAQKNLFAAGMIPSSLIPSSSGSSPPPLVPPNITSSDGYSIRSYGAGIDVQSKFDRHLPGLGRSMAVMMDHIEIGSQVPLFLGNGGTLSAWSFVCRFCDYKCIEDNPALLEDHCRLTHKLELTNAKAKAVAAATMAGIQRDHDGQNLSKSALPGQDQTGSLMSLQSMVTGFPPSMLAAAAGYSNAQNILAAAQAAGINLPGTASLPSSSASSSSSSPSYYTDPLMRSLAQQMVGTDHSPPAGDAFHRQQMAALNNAIQQAAALNTANAVPADQQQIRQLLYQQMLMQSPFFSSNPALAAAIPRPLSGSRGEMSPLAQFWQYQKMLEMTSRNSNENMTTNSDDGDNGRNKFPTSAASNQMSPKRNRKTSSSSQSSSPENGGNVANDDGKQVNIHGWKQCQDCDFTAKGAHGLDLHSRKAHASRDDSTSSPKGKFTDDVVSEEARISSPKNESVPRAEKCGSSDPTKQQVPLNVLDLSGQKVDDETSSQNIATQTEDREESEISDNTRRSCSHCDVTFGDDTMHALHMSCHDRNDPFKCTICGQECHEKYYFNVHLLRGLHQSVKNKKSSRDEFDGSEVKFGRRHSNTSEKSFSSLTSSVGSKETPKRSLSSGELPNGDITSPHDVEPKSNT